MTKRATYEELAQKIKELKREVVEHRRDEESLHLSEERYKGIFKNTKNGVAVYKVVNDGQDFIFANFNEAAEKIEKIKKDALIGKSVTKVFPAVKDFGLFEVFQRVWKTGKPELYPIAMYKDERIQGWRDNFVYKLPSEEIVAVYSDETQRKKTEEELRESESKLSAMLTSIGNHMSMMDKELNILWVNEIAEKIFGNDIIGKKCYEVYHKRTEPCEPYPCITLKAFKDGMIHKHETQVIDQKGEIIIFHCTANVALRDKEGKPTAVLEISRDITKQKSAEDALRNAHDELERRVIERTKDLEIKTKSLMELNMSMNVLLEKRVEDRILLEDNVLTNVKKLIEPLFDKMRETELDDHQKMILRIIESNLNEITSPLTRKLSLKHLKLTPTEIKIANLIRHGSTTKKIAKLMNSSPRTIDTHRKNIRRKIGLDKKGGNLRSYLLSIH